MGLKANPGFKNSTAPPRFEIPGSAPGNDSAQNHNKACLEALLSAFTFISVETT